MNNTWMSKVAGSLNIISGCISLLLVLFLVVATGIVGDTLMFTGVAFWLPVNVVGILWAFIIPITVHGIVALVGGVYAVQDKRWGMALAGSIAAIFPIFIFGIASIVLIALSKENFDRQTTVDCIPATNEIA